MFRMIDVCGGKMSLKEVNSEIRFYMYHKTPKRLIVDIQLKDDGYHATFWMSKKDFRKQWQPSLPREEE